MNDHNTVNIAPVDIDPLDSVDFLTDFEGFHSDALFLCKVLEASSSTSSNDPNTDISSKRNSLVTTNNTPSIPPTKRHSSIISLEPLDRDMPTSYGFAAEPNSSFTKVPSSVQGVVPTTTTSMFGSLPVMDSIKVPEMPKLIVPTSMTSNSIAANGANDVNDDNITTSGPRFRAFHEKKWDERLLELRAFGQEHGHSLVPHTYPPNPQLARWVKRQRRQHKLMQEGKSSTMTPEREELLESLGFVWDSHQAAWTEKICDLTQYQARHGHCLVPSSYKANPQLATWVKCQRRQYKLYWEGKPSAMTPQRISELEGMGFVWELRSSSSR